MKNAGRRDVLKIMLVGTVLGAGGLALNKRAEARDSGSNPVEEYSYRGRRVTLQTMGKPSAGVHSLMSTVFIDGRPLHVMRYPNGRFTSVMNHFETFATLRETANAAVDSLRGANLVAMHHS
jgi:hypothetical protein